MTAHRPLSAPEFEAYRLARLVAADRYPYFMRALWATSPVAAPGLGTLAVDREWRLYLDPALLVGENRWETAVLASVLIHEIGHLVRDHAGRSDALPAPASALAWNLAGDAEINDDLLAAGVPLPEGCITPETLGCADRQVAEVYYDHLMRSAADALPDDGGPGCGSGSGSAPAPGELPAGIALDDGVAEPISAAEGDYLRREIARDVLDGLDSGKDTGAGAAALERWARRTLAPPTVPWTALLRSGVRRCIADRAGLVDYSYRRPSRRQVAGIVKPSMRAPLVSVALVVDTSASMSAADLDDAVRESAGVLRSCGVARERVALVACDADAHVSWVRDVHDLRLVGGGGTDMRVGIRAAEDQRRPADVIVVFTDGYTPWPEHPTRARLIVALIGEHASDTAPPWALTVRVPPRARTGAA